MRASLGGMGLALLMAGCAASPAVAPQTLPPVATRAQGGRANTPQLVRQLVLATFDRADKNHDRFLDASEWDRTDLNASDKDKDGRLTTLEWAESHPIEPLTAIWQAAAQDYFGKLDADRDGSLSRTEARGLAAVPAFGLPKDVYFDRYAGANGTLAPRAFTDFLLQIAYDNGRFKPFLVPPAFPATAPSAAPTAPAADPGETPVVQAPTGPHPMPLTAVAGQAPRS